MSETVKRLPDAKSYEDYKNASYNILTGVHTKEKLELAKKTLDAARLRLLETSDDFRENTQRQMEQSRMNATGRLPVVHMPTWDALTWACPECGNANVNWKGFKNKKKRKEYSKRYGLNERQLRRDKGIRICIICSQRLGRDVWLMQIAPGNIPKIKEKYMEKKIKGKLFRYTR